MLKKNIPTTTLQLEPGMYIARLQHVYSDNGAIIAISLAPQVTPGTATFFCSDSVSNNILQTTHDCIVIRVSNDRVTLLVTGSEETKDLLSLKVDKISALNFSEKIEPLPGLDNEHANRHAKNVVAIPSQRQPEKIKLAGHIEWQGDVKKTVGERVGNPNTQKRLEGFVIEWVDKPENVDIAYSCTVQGMGRSPILLSGDFAGTRGRNSAITSLSISLAGKNSTKYVLEGRAFFAGVEPQDLRPEVECKGPTGQEQLVALEIKVLRKVTTTKKPKIRMALT